jgi:hypothetical protein
MCRIALGLALFALLADPGLAASAQSTRKPAGRKARSQPAPAPRPPLPEELPPTPPTVTYQEGMLSIAAQNSTLYDILSAVRRATGAAVDTPASATERVATRLGPGRPRDVLAALLDGSRFDYILLSSPEDPGGLRRVILAPRSGGGAGGAPDAPGAPASPPGALFSQPARPVPARTLPPDTGEELPEESVEPAEEVQPEPEPAPPQQRPEIKTPEQLQEQLRRHEEEQRNQPQEQQPQSPPQPPQ